MTDHNIYTYLRAAFPREGQALSSGMAILGERSLSWRDLDASVARMANHLIALGVGPGERVAAQVDKSVESMMLYLATVRAGAVYVPLNTAYKAGEIEHFVQDAQPAVLVCAVENQDWIVPIAQAAGVRHLFTLGVNGDGSWMSAIGDQDTSLAPRLMGADALAAIIYTSGTTGRSKGAMLSHGNLRSNAEVLKRYWDWRTDDVLIHALPIFHVHGLFVALHAALGSGCPMIWMDRFDPAQALQHLSRATVFMGVPTLYTRLLAQPVLNAQRMPRMRLFVSGSAPLLQATFDAWKARTGHTLLERYGMSETLMLTSNPCRPDERYAMASERRAGTVGFPLPGVSLRIADGAGQVLPAGAVGGIEVRGPSVFLGYWRMPDKTAEEFTADGWFKTGDVGLQDERGYVHIVGRSKDVIISGGYNVYPAEVESRLNALPGVLDSALVGVPHPDFGEVGVAVVVAQAGATLHPADVLDGLKRQLANYKIPKHCAIVSELPRNAMGKVQKNLLRDTYRTLCVD